MKRLIGREAELAQANSILESARTQSIARILRLVGESGVGKSALGAAICGEATSRGWFCSLVPAHRIQVNLPLVFARRMADAILSGLGAVGAHYASGIEHELRNPATGANEVETSIEGGLFHLLEGVLLDMPMLLIIDDMHWVDDESRGLLRRLSQTFADRRLVLVIIERPEELTETIDPSEDVTLLGTLDVTSTQQLARDLLPGASERVIAAIAEHVRGRAIDLVAVANEISDPSTITEDAITATVRTTISKSIALLRPAMREFLQICALIAEPIEYSILNSLWSEDSLVPFIREASGRYLIQRQDGLHFVHSTVAQSIRETVPIEIPYRKRIINALRELPSLTTEHYEQIVEQAAACGDRALEQQYLLRLVDEAQKTRNLPLVARALTRVIFLSPFNGEQTLALYLRLATTHLALNHERDAIIVSSEGLDQAAMAGIRVGLGQLAASLLFALWHGGDRGDFERTYDRYDEHLVDPVDRAQLLSVRIYADYADNDRAKFQEHRAEFENLEVKMPVLDTRIASFEGMLQAREGRYDAAERLLNRARSVDGTPLALRTMVETCGAIAAFQQFGVENEYVKRALEMLPRRDALRIGTEAMSMLSSGAPEETMEFVNEALVFEEGCFARRVLLGIAGSASILGNISLPAQLERLLAADAELVLRGQFANSLAPVAAWAAYKHAATDRDVSNLFLKKARAIGQNFLEPQVFWLPVVFALAAAQTKHTETLTAIDRGETVSDLSPWGRLQFGLSKYVAAFALGKPQAASEFAELRRECSVLGAHFFADALNRRFPITSTGVASPSRDAKLTRREREVVEMVADGASNREIATALVLSERTVEGHVANIFGKLDVGSRSQIAAWHVRNTVGAS